MGSREKQWEYPIAPRDNSVVDDYHGEKIADPFRPLENPNDQKTKDFVEKQVKLTRGLIGKFKKKVSKIISKLIISWKKPHRTVVKQGDKHFFYCNARRQAQDVLYVRGIRGGKGKELLNPNLLSEDGTVSVRTLSVSQNAEYLAYGLSSSGSDWMTIKVKRVDDKSDEPGTLSWVKFSDISWTHDSKGFFYSRYPAPKEGGIIDAGTETDSYRNHQLYYHFLGTDQSEDILCWKDPANPKHLFNGRVTRDGKYLLLYIRENSNVNKLYHCNLSSLPEGLEGFRTKNDLLPFVKMIDRFEAKYEVIANDETVFTFRTNKDAPKYKLVQGDLNKPISNWKDFIEEHKNDVLVSAYVIKKGRIIIKYLRNVKYVQQVRDFTTGSLLSEKPIDFESVDGTSARWEESVAFNDLTSFFTLDIGTPYVIGPEVPNRKKSKIKVPRSSSEGYEVKQVVVRSKDGTVDIPMLIYHRKKIKLDGSHPCLLRAYGGFGTIFTATLNKIHMAVAKHLSFVLCIPNIRGGGEHGEDWHKAGALAKKQNSIDDVICVTEYLIRTGYTQRGKLCIEGESNGGLLIAACINQRPELFGCALVNVALTDMLRYHKFTIGHAWTSEYGCSDNEEEFLCLRKYSPLHNVHRPWDENPGEQYPATMILTGDHDDRVVPLHSYKLAATMQHVLCTSLENSPQTNPILLRVERNAGHGAGRSTQQMINEYTDKYAFMLKWGQSERSSLK